MVFPQMPWQPLSYSSSQISYYNYIDIKKYRFLLDLNLINQIKKTKKKTKTTKYKILTLLFYGFKFHI